MLFDLGGKTSTKVMVTSQPWHCNTEVGYQPMSIIPIILDSHKTGQRAKGMIFRIKISWSQAVLNEPGLGTCRRQLHVTIHKGAESKQNDPEGRKASARNLEYLEQHQVRRNQTSYS
jgi:hypothetical protein